jgi:hypothetical protein
MFTPKKRTVKPGDAFENTEILQWFENVMGCREDARSSLICETDTTNRFLASS